MMLWLSRIRTWLHRHDHPGHNVLDYACEHWMGDRAGSISARCTICNPL